MGQYKPTGSLCWVNKNGVTVSFTGTELSSNAAIGDIFNVRGENALYAITAVDSNTLIHISPNYAGNTISSSAFEITKDFTPSLGLTEISAGDVDWPYHLTDGVIRRVDMLLSGGETINSLAANTITVNKVITPWVTPTANVTTFSVANGSLFRINNTQVTTITNLTNGTDGQEVTLMFTNGNSRVGTANFYLNNATTLTSAANMTLKVVLYSTKWYELCRSDNA